MNGPGLAAPSWAVALRGSALRAEHLRVTVKDHRLRPPLAALLSMLVVAPAVAQQPAQQPPAPQPAGVWAKLPRMQLERQFAGPLPDTVIQRWRDPVDGMICYTYLPISAQHTAPTATGFVQYGPNSIGSISCVGIATPQAAKPPPPRPR